MDDTPQHIKQKQYDIIMSKPLKERIYMAFDMIDFSRSLIRSSIKRDIPDISPIDLHLELFRRFYKNDFDDETMEKIISQMKEYLINKNNESSQ